MKNILKIIACIIIAYISGSLFLTAVNTAYQVSEHPELSLLIRMIFFALFVLLAVIGRKELVVFALILGFPFYRIGFNGISIVLIISLIVAILYRKEIGSSIFKTKQEYKIPFFVLAICILYSFIVSKHYMTALTEVAHIVNLIILYLILVSYLVSWQKIRILLGLLLAVNIIGIVVTILQYIFGINSIKFFIGEYAPNVGVYDSVKRIPGFFWESQGAGIYYAIMFILSIGILSVVKKYRLLLMALAIMNIGALLLTGTRIAIIALVCGLSLLMAWKLTMKKIVLYTCMLSILVVCGGLIYNYVIPAQMKDRLTGYELEGSYNERHKIWITSLPIARHNPLGVGLSRADLFDAAYNENSYLQTKYYLFASLRNRMGFESSFLDLLYSLGYLGLIGFLALLLCFFILAFRNANINPPSDESGYSKYLACAMVVWLVGAATSEKVYEIQPMTIFVILLAIVHSTYSRIHSGRAI
ncbi:MAG: O-antigen ligase family protein [Candidatus Omnitrophota bacterium]|jgi:O-antigen ligase